MRLKVQWLHTFSLWAAPVGTEPTVIQNLLICPLSAAYWSSIKLKTFLLCQHKAPALSVGYVMPKQHPESKISAENSGEIYHIYRISAKSPVLKNFIRIHFLTQSGKCCWLPRRFFFTALAWISHRNRRRWRRFLLLLLLCPTPHIVPSGGNFHSNVSSLKLYKKRGGRFSPSFRLLRIIV